MTTAALADAVSNIERIQASELSQNVTLSRSVGWHDVEGEWRVLHAAADVLGIREGARLIAQGALADYGVAASLAKMVVSSEHQRRGLGRRLLDRFVQQAEARDIPIGLCATEQGRPLYESRGFEVSGELVVLFGTPTLDGPASASVAPLVDVQQAVAQDAALLGCDRGRMLRARSAEACARFMLTGSRRGFGLATPQGEHALVGPILAENAGDAQELCRAVFAAVARPLRLDVPAQHVELRRWLVSLGLREMAVRVEMARGAPRLPWQVAERYALATQAWG